MSGQKAAGVDWGAVFQKLYGRPAGKPTPPHIRPLQELGKDVLALLEKQHKPIIRQVAVEAAKAGLGDYLQYVFFLLNEQQNNWPTLPPRQQAALEAVQDILSETGGTPTYTGGLKLPPEELESQTDQALVNIAAWAHTDFRRKVQSEYDATVKRHMPAMSRFVPLDQKDAFAATMLKALFETTVTQYPNLFDQGHLLDSVIVDLLR